MVFTSMIHVLRKAKSLVIEAVKDDGTCVLNADDPWVMKVKEKAKGRHILVSANNENSIILDNINKGGTAIYLENNCIYLVNEGSIRDFIWVYDIPATLEGRLKHNIYNSMAAIGAAFALGVPIYNIKNVLGEFTCDADVNPGRFNIYNQGKFKVVLDYGHNIDGYRVTIEGLKALNPVHILSVIGVPGDRLDSDIFNVGKISGNFFDYIYIKEDRDLRGRQLLEVADILYEGALSGGISGARIKTIPDEVEALSEALQQAEEGDIIVVFFEKMEPLVNFIKAYKNTENWI